MSLPRFDFLDGPPQPRWGWALLSLATVAVLAAASQCWLLTQQLSSLQAQLRPNHARSINGSPVATLRASRLALSGELTAPWENLLAVFEEHSSAEVGLLKLEPDSRTGLVRVQGQAKDLLAVFSYVKELEADTRLLDVNLVNHQVEREQAGRPVRFQIEASWRATSRASARRTGSS